MSSHVNGYLERGISLKAEGRYDEAVTEFRELLNNDPNSSDGHHQLGLVYGFTGMFDESLEELQHAVTLAPTRMDLRNDLALTYSMLGTTRLNASLKRCYAVIRRINAPSTT